MSSSMKLVVYLALPIAGCLAFLDRGVVSTETKSIVLVRSEESSAPPPATEFIEVIDLTQSLPSEKQTVDLQVAMPENDPIPLEPVRESKSGMSKLLSHWRQGYDWGHAVIDR